MAKKAERTTHVCTYCGFSGIAVSHHKSAKQKVERSRSPQQVQAWGRYGAVVPKLRRRKQSENKHLFPQEVYKSEA